MTFGTFCEETSQAVLMRSEAKRQHDKPMKEEAQFFGPIHKLMGRACDVINCKDAAKRKVRESGAVADFRRPDKIVKIHRCGEETALGVPTFYVRLQKPVMSVLPLFNKRKADEVAMMMLGDFRLGQLSHHHQGCGVPFMLVRSLRNETKNTAKSSRFLAGMGIGCGLGTMGASICTLERITLSASKTMASSSSPSSRCMILFISIQQITSKCLNYEDVMAFDLHDEL